jgi:23S rRNA (adenine2503-C2)-methyltransferase
MSTKLGFVTSATLQQLAERFKGMGLPGYRAKQVWKWVWEKLALDYRAMTDLPAGLRARLGRELPVTGLSVETVRRSARDATAKALLAAADGEHVEAVAMPDEESGRLSICVSTQIGCAMACAFCASAAGGLQRNLDVSEILDQVLIMSDLAGEPPSNVVLMGMGEPLANYENCREAVRRMNSAEWLGIGARHITVSTVGLVAKMARLADEWPPVKLAVSLHAPNDELRRKLIPAARKHSIAEILEAAAGYAQRTSRHFTAEYVLISGVNAARKHAEELARLLRRLPAKVNLIAVNPGGAGEFAAPGEARVRAFREVLVERGVETTIRKRRGRDIEAACGQLRLRETGK